MELKKKIKNFFTLTRKANGGFTLVELIVVIAILAILAGAGTAGYAGYIKAANKGNDKVLVGNIIRAIETGTYSNAFVNENSFTKGATTYPVGMVILTKDGCQVKASAASIKTTENSPCVIETKTIVPEGAYTFKTESNLLGMKYDIYTVNEGQLKTVSYCKTHATLNESEVYTKWSWGSPKDQKKYVFEKNCTGAYQLYSDHVDGNVLTSENFDQFGVLNSITEVGNHAIYDSLAAAFGDVGALTLTYDGWGDVEKDGHTYATLLTYTESLITDIQGLADLLTSDLVAPFAHEHLSKDYTSSVDMMDAAANYITTAHPTMDSWMNKWNAAADHKDVTYTFGLEGKDYIYSARKAYNTAFASYCDANGINSAYVTVIKDYHHTASLVLPIPDVVNEAAFKLDKTNEDSLYYQLAQKGCTDKEFNDIYALFGTYKNSEACRKNGETFYNTMHTIKDTGAEALKNGDGGVNGYFDYYGKMMSEMSMYYDFIKGYTGSGVIVLVSVEDGIVKCEVSPSSANPRN